MADPTTFKSGSSPLPKSGKLPGPLGKVVLGLPLWAWLLIVSAAMALAFYIRSRNTASDYETADTAADQSYDTATSADGGGVSDEGTGTETGYAGSDGFEDFIDTPVDDGTDTPAKNDPQIIINLNQQGNGPAKGGPCGKKPTKPAKKGYHWKCQGKKWIQAKNTPAAPKKDKPKPKPKPKKRRFQEPTSLRPSNKAPTIGGGSPRATSVRTKPPTPAQRRR